MSYILLILALFLLTFCYLRSLYSCIIDYQVNNSARRKRRKGQTLIEWILYRRYRKEIPRILLITYFGCFPFDRFCFSDPFLGKPFGRNRFSSFQTDCGGRLWSDFHFGNCFLWKAQKWPDICQGRTLDQKEKKAKINSLLSPGTDRYDESAEIRTRLLSIPERPHIHRWSKKAMLRKRFAFPARFSYDGKSCLSI